MQSLAESRPGSRSRCCPSVMSQVDTHVTALLVTLERRAGLHAFLRPSFGGEDHMKAEMSASGSKVVWERREGTPGRSMRGGEVCRIAGGAEVTRSGGWGGSGDVSLWSASTDVIAYGAGAARLLSAQPRSSSSQPLSPCGTGVLDDVHTVDPKDEG
eukprot:1763523-Rhodomonas_salina.2